MPKVLYGIHGQEVSTRWNLLEWWLNDTKNHFMKDPQLLFQKYTVNGILWKQFNEVTYEQFEDKQRV